MVDVARVVRQEWRRLPASVTSWADAARLRVVVARRPRGEAPPGAMGAFIAVVECPTILLYECNLTTCDDVRLTLLHELGHALGMTETELHVLGLG